MRSLSAAADLYAEKVKSDSHTRIHLNKVVETSSLLKWW